MISISILRTILMNISKDTLIDLHKELRYMQFENEGEEAPALRENKEVTLILKEIERRLQMYYGYKSEGLDTYGKDED